MEKAKGLMVVQTVKHLTAEQREQIADHLMPLADALGLSVAIASGGVDITVHYDPAPMVEALNRATEALNAAADRLNVQSGPDRSGFDGTGLDLDRIR